MKKRIPSYLSGVLTTVLVLTLTTTALAVSGKVTFNFSNVSLHGEQKIVAGADITVANGQKVPSSILYTDVAGGKTNYLPIRAISELLGVEIGYDSATKTVLLNRQSEESNVTDAGSLGEWQRKFEGNQVWYTTSGRSKTPYAQAPAWRPTWLPEGWGLNNSSVESASNALITATYQNNTDDTDSSLFFHCYAPFDRKCGDVLGDQGVKGVKMLQAATVQGRTADFYKTEDGNLLVWTDAVGNLFKLRGDLDQATLEQIANNVMEVSKDAMPEYKMQWTPKGSYNTSRTAIPGVVSETWKDAGDVSFTFMYAREPLAVPTRVPESVTVNGVKAQFWAGDPDGGFELDRGNGVPTHIYTQEQKNILLWTDPNTNLTFRMMGMMPKEDMVRMAESIA